MNNRRRHKAEFHHQQEAQRTRSYNRKPPHGNWQPAIPSWEKRFCHSVGLIPWPKLLEAKKFMYLYDDILKWNDSAGEEAFQNAKNRFWAEINGLPCNVSLPDPDIYIDKIDWDCNVDPELLLELEQEPKELGEINKEEVVILGNSLNLNQSFSCTGWGDAEDNLQKAFNHELDPIYEGCKLNGSNYETHQETGAAKTNGAEEYDGWGNSCGWDNSNDEWNNNSYSAGKNVNGTTGGAWGTWDGNNRKREDAGWNMSRYKTSRFHGDYYQQSDRGWWRSGRGRKRVNFVY